MEPIIKTTESLNVETNVPPNPSWRINDNFDDDFLADEKTRKPKGKKIKKMRSSFDR